MSSYLSQRKKRVAAQKNSSLKNNEENTSFKSINLDPSNSVLLFQKRSIEIEELPMSYPSNKKAESLHLKKKQQISQKKTHNKNSVKQHKTNKNERILSLERRFYNSLQDYILTPEEMLDFGFPVIVNGQLCIRPCFTYSNNRLTIFHGNTDVDSDDTGYVSSGDDAGGERLNSDSKKQKAFERTCSRCQKQFFTTRTKYITKQQCRYHWGKIQGITKNAPYLYTCCHKPPGTEGCSFNKLHVWSGLAPGVKLKRFVQTKNKGKKRGVYEIYALDCEMCYTAAGLEVCKVTVVDMYGRSMYNNFVKPECEVVDYNTRFSGVTEQCVKSRNARTFRQVQQELLSMISRETILIGHGLENDLRVLKLLHSKIVDTSLVFPHSRGLPFRSSLKQLVSIHLKKDIQTALNGHDSFEDANSCMELMLWKIRQNLQEHDFSRRNSLPSGGFKNSLPS